MRFANCFERVAISKAKLIPLVYFSASRLCDLCDLRVSASHWRHVHHARGLAEYGEATSSRFVCGNTLQKCEEGTQRTDLNADALAFGETRRIKRTETRRDCCFFVNDCFGVIITCTILPCPP